MIDVLETLSTVPSTYLVYYYYVTKPNSSDIPGICIKRVTSNIKKKLMRLFKRGVSSGLFGDCEDDRHQGISSSFAVAGKCVPS